MSLRRGLAVGSALLFCGAVTAVLPTASRIVGRIATRAGSGLALAFVLAFGLGLILEASGRMVRQSRRRGERLHHRMVVAEVRSVSYFAGEALEGLIALGDMGQLIEEERQTLRGRSVKLLLGAFVMAAAAVVLTGWGVETGRPLPALATPLLAALPAAAALTGAARAIANVALALEPEEAHIHAALVRHHERLEAERLAMRPNLAALAGAVVVDPAPARPKAA
jgi:hypothetical protein